MLFKLFCTISIFFTLPALAGSYICSDRNITQVMGSFTSAKAAEKFYPPFVKLTDETVQWGKSRTEWYKPWKNIGDGGNSWEAVNGKFRWKFKYKKARRNLQVLLVHPLSTKVNVQPLFYKNCKLLSSSGINSIVQTRVQNTFNGLSACDRKYVQQFLKGQGLYNGRIDGAWGPGTASAISKAGKKGKLRGLSTEAIIARLSENLMCD